jgi:hypothetical protein
MGGGMGKVRARTGGGGSGGASGGGGVVGGAGRGEGAAAGLGAEMAWYAAPAISPIFESGNFISPKSNPAPVAKSPTMPPNVGRRRPPGATEGRARTS